MRNKNNDIPWKVEIFNLAGTYEFNSQIRYMPKKNKIKMSQHTLESILLAAGSTFSNLWHQWSCTLQCNKFRVATNKIPINEDLRDLSGVKRIWYKIF